MVSCRCPSLFLPGVAGLCVASATGGLPMVSRGARAVSAVGVMAVSATVGVADGAAILTGSAFLRFFTLKVVSNIILTVEITIL